MINQVILSLKPSLLVNKAALPGCFYLVDRMGIEPTTFRMPCERSAAELPALCQNPRYHF